MIRFVPAFLLLAMNIWAIMDISQSNASKREKVFWSALILAFPVIGFLVWYIAGPGTKTL